MVVSFADLIHKKIIEENWLDIDSNNFDNISINYGIRPAFGYSILPDHSQNRKVFDILQAEEIEITLTDTFSMEQASSICGMIINNPNARYFNIKHD